MHHLPPSPPHDAAQGTEHAAPPVLAGARTAKAGAETAHKVSPPPPQRTPCHAHTTQNIQAWQQYVPRRPYASPADMSPFQSSRSSPPSRRHPQSQRRRRTTTRGQAAQSPTMTKPKVSRCVLALHTAMHAVRHGVPLTTDTQFYTPISQIPKGTARRDAQRLTKSEKAKLPRVTAYCTAACVHTLYMPRPNVLTTLY